MADVDLHDRIAVTIPIAAELTGVAVNTIRAACDKGELDKHYPTTTPIIYVLDLHEWVKSLPTTRPKAQKK